MKLNKNKRLVILVMLVVAVALVCGSALAAEDAALLSAEESSFTFAGTWWAAVPPVVAIALALITKEVYLSLFLGISVGALFLAIGSGNVLEVLANTMTGIFSGESGMIGSLTDGANVGILIFLVGLGIVGSLIYKAGGSAAYGKWAETHIKTKKGAQAATFGLGVLIFVDDYFNCLTVGSVMRPVTDQHKISRAKLAYLVDSTAAPVCIIAPISSWAAAVAGSMLDAGIDTAGYNPFSLFIHSIPFNFYALLTLTFVVCMICMDFDFGLMKKFEKNAQNGDVHTSGGEEFENANDVKFNSKGKVIDLVLPVIVLIVLCVLGLIFTGVSTVTAGNGWVYSAEEFATAGFGDKLVMAFAECNASVGLVYGVFVSLVFMLVYFLARKVLSLKEYADCIVSGFRAMVPSILILTFAWTLSGVTGALGLAEVVATAIDSAATNIAAFLPFVICLVAMGLSFATGTSWGTFGILLPIVLSVFRLGAGNDALAFVGIAACLSGAVFGDHVSPISDTTIMSSAGAQSNHINHVRTQAPYAIICAACACVFFIIAGLFPVWYVITPVSILVMIGLCFLLKHLSAKKDAKVEPAA
ncbi:MAG: Na+/H+ antiporter NhaC family protein [Clostridia bacterium]|nr:Na+/H+ antiporter NhaC family protein [Clostridia bacterium]